VIGGCHPIPIRLVEKYGVLDEFTFVLRIYSGFFQGDAMTGYAQKGLGKNLNAYSPNLVIAHNCPRGRLAIDSDVVDFGGVCLEKGLDLVSAVHPSS